MARLYLCLLLVLCCIDSLAQRRLVVVDMDLLVPVAGANVVSRQGVQAQLVGANPSTAASFDLGKVISALIPKKWRPGYKKAQRKKRLKEILEEY